MGRAGDPRLTLRFSVAEFAALDSAAAALGVETGALARAAAVRGVAAVVAGVESGGLRLRARSGSGSVKPEVVELAAGAGGVLASPVASRAPVDVGVARAVAFRAALCRPGGSDDSAGS